MLEQLKRADRVELLREHPGEVRDHPQLDIQPKPFAMAFRILAAVDPGDVGFLGRALQEGPVATANVEQALARDDAVPSKLEVFAPRAILVFLAGRIGVDLVQLFVKCRFPGQRGRMKETVAGVVAAMNFDLRKIGEGRFDVEADVAIAIDDDAAFERCRQPCCAAGQRAHDAARCRLWLAHVPGSGATAGSRSRRYKSP